MHRYRAFFIVLLTPFPCLCAQPVLHSKPHVSVEHLVLAPSDAGLHPSVLPAASIFHQVNLREGTELPDPANFPEFWHPIGEILSLPEAEALLRSAGGIEGLPKAKNGKVMEAWGKVRQAASRQISVAAHDHVAENPPTKFESEGLRSHLLKLERIRLRLKQLGATEIYDGGILHDARKAVSESISASRGRWVDLNAAMETDHLNHVLGLQKAGLPAELLALKLQKSVDSVTGFARAFASLGYRHAWFDLYRQWIDATPLLPALHGDLWRDNVYLVEKEARKVPMPVDLDDSGPGFAALDLLRTLGFLAMEADPLERKSVVKKALEAYRAGLFMEFSDWVEMAQAEEAVADPRIKNKDWRSVGTPIDNSGIIAWLRTVLDLSGDEWEFYERKGAGVGSLGVDRYLMFSPRGEILELKGLPPVPSVSHYSSGVAGSLNGSRYAAISAILPLNEIGLIHDGSLAYTLMRRKPFEYRLNKGHPKSVARILGGLLAQIHRMQAEPEELLSSIEWLYPGIVLYWADYMLRMQSELVRLYKSNPSFLGIPTDFVLPR